MREPRNPRGNQAPHKLVIRSIAHAIREGIDVDLMIDFHRMVLRGFEPVWAIDEDREWYVGKAANAPAPTLDQKMKSLQWLTERGYGMPAQEIHLNADLRAMVEGGPSLKLGQLAGGAAMFASLHATLVGGDPYALTDGEPHDGAPDPAQVIDAEFTEGAADPDPSDVEPSADTDE